MSAKAELSKEKAVLSKVKVESIPGNVLEPTLEELAGAAWLELAGAASLPACFTEELDAT